MHGTACFRPATHVETAPRGATRARLGAGRWHFQHGPIDLVLGADGEPGAVSGFVEDAWARAQGVLAELVGELPLLRAPAQPGALHGPVSRRMQAACLPHRPHFITPMAAVAGAVADELISLARDRAGLQRAYCNNGGDIALHLLPGTCYRIGLFADLGRIRRQERWRLDGDAVIDAALPVRGVATSGWRGRSFSLGIADAVTVLAANAALADAAATMIANAVNVDHPGIGRVPARALDADSDLGERLVTIDVPALPEPAVAAALAAGARHAQQLLDGDLVFGAVLWLQGRSACVGMAAPALSSSCTLA